LNGPATNKFGGDDMSQLTWSTFVTWILLTQSPLGWSAELSLDPAHAWDTSVTGSAAPNSVEVTVYDISYPAQTKLGEGAVDENGKFAISIYPPLQEGHSLIVEDHLKVISPAITVLEPRVGPVQ
jgi:hypothetical protein